MKGTGSEMVPVSDVYNNYLNGTTIYTPLEANSMYLYVEERIILSKPVLTPNKNLAKILK